MGNKTSIYAAQGAVHFCTGVAADMRFLRNHLVQCFISNRNRRCDKWQRVELLGSRWMEKASFNHRLMWQCEAFSHSHPLLVVVNEELNPLAMTHTLLSQFGISHTLISSLLLPHIHPPCLLLSLTERTVINTLMSAGGQNLRHAVRQQDQRSPSTAAVGRKYEACDDVY